jgi:hypothetical protein
MGLSSHAQKMNTSTRMMVNASKKNVVITNTLALMESAQP